MKNKNLHSLIDTVLLECGYKENSYIKALNDGSLTKEDFAETQIQFYWAVVFFSRPMSALAAKIPFPELRIEVLRNVWEEHGEGDAVKAHGSTFLEFLARLDQVSIDDIEQRSLWPEIRAFNTILSGVCVLDEYLTGVAMMGMIERMFVDFSAWIGRGVIARGWLTNNTMIHYSMHEKLDIKHSDDFFNILKKSWDTSLEDQYSIEQGLRLGAYVFNNLYEGMYKARSKRAFRNVKGMHSRAEG